MRVRQFHWARRGGRVMHTHAPRRYYHLPLPHPRMHTSPSPTHVRPPPHTHLGRRPEGCRRLIMRPAKPPAEKRWFLNEVGMPRVAGLTVRTWRGPGGLGVRVWVVWVGTRWACPK